MTKTYIMNNLVEKMLSPDQDHRYMGLTDLMAEIKQDPSNFSGDEAIEYKVLQHVLKLVEDKISEVKNQAVKCLGALIKLVRERHMEFVIVRLVEFSGSSDEELRDIAGLALKTITAELPQESKLVPTLCTQLVPKLLEQLKNPNTPPETLIEILAILSIFISRFPGSLSSPSLQPQPTEVLTPLLVHPRPAVRKRAILTLAQFLPAAPESFFDSLLETTIRPGLAASARVDSQRTTVLLVASIARHSPQRISGAIPEVVAGVIAAAGKEDDELREYALQALEVFVLRCPSEVTPFLSQIIQAPAKLIKYDPNYAGDDDEDEEMADAEGDDDDDDLDGYSDDEDTSYKIRRAAAKVLAAIIETRPELLSALYKEVSPVLISRFGDREENVKLEVWATYSSLLNQTRVYGGSSSRSSAGGGKRKRGSADDDGEYADAKMDGMDVEGSPISLLKAQVPGLAKSLLAQLKTGSRSNKTSPNILQSGFALLLALVSVLPGSLSQFVPQVAAASSSVLSQASSTSTLALQTTCLSFLALFFSSHAPASFNSVIPQLTPPLLRNLSERHPRVAAESFRAFSALLNALRPVSAASEEWVLAVYNESIKRLRSADTDADVRACAETCMGDLWVCATDIIRSKGDGREWDAMCRTTGRMEGPVAVVARVAREVDVGDAWVNGSIEWLLGVLKRSGKSGKTDIFACLDVLLRRYKSGIPNDLIPTLIDQMKPYISLNDISLLSQALLALALLLELSPAQSYPIIEGEYLKDVCIIAHSPSVSGAALEAMLTFFSALVQADAQIATHVIPNLVTPLAKEKKADLSFMNVAKCVGVIVKCHQGLAAGTIAEFSKALKKGSTSKTSQLPLSLLIFGEIGRTIDFSNQKDIFQAAVDLFNAPDDEVRSAAAFAAGNIAVGNLHLFLPVIVKLVQTDKDKRLPALHAIKEVVNNCPSGHLEAVAETIWVPLFEDSANSEEATRNIAAACLGKLTTTNPSRYLPQLQARIRDADPAARATVVAAIRYTIVDSTGACDELLSALIPDFLSPISDEDLTVQRLAISALNSAARHKPELIRDHLAVLLPSLYKETHIKKHLIRIVEMGPWKHKVDDGLEARKTAYETMYTLLDTLLTKLDLHEFLGRVVAGLADDSDEIKVLSHMMIFRFSQVASTAIVARLDEIAPQLEKSMKGPKVGSDTVKQEIERAAELQRSTIRAVSALHKVASPGTSSRFDTLVDDIQRGSYGVEFKDFANH